MPSTLNVEDELVDALRAQARNRELSWEQWALRILTAAADPLNESSWSELNRRRLELIDAKYDRGLTADERRELTALQAAAEKHLERLDRGRMTWLDHYIGRAKQVAQSDG